MLRKDATGYRFVRQKPLGIFIADFYCAALQLVVEVDGGYHLDRLEYDSRRDTNLAEMGIRIYRINADLLLINPDAVLDGLLWHTATLQ